MHETSMPPCPQRRRVLTLLAAGVVLPAGKPFAASYPDRPLHAIVPFPAGQGADILIRFLGDAMSRTLGQSIIVENRAGAGGTIGTRDAARAAPDGYTLYVGSSGPIAIAPRLYRNIRYDPVRDFAPICDIATVTQVLVTSPSSGIKSVQQLIADARRNPGGVQYASVGKGSTSHLTMELFAQSAGLALEHIPYKGGPPAQADILGGRVPIMFDSAPGVLPAIRAGKLVALGVSSRQRLALLPDVPTIAESGVPGFETVGWIGLFAPAGTPANAIAALHDAAVLALREPATRRRFEELGFVPVGDSPEAFAQYVRSEVALWGRVIARAKVTMD